MNYIFDTNILLYFIRQHKVVGQIESNENPFSDENISMISIVSKAEILSIAHQSNWGESRRKKLNELLNEFLIIPIEADDIINMYAEIDAYSQGKLAGKPLPNGGTSRNMGKNDLWIAASAFLTQATLITTDGDFDHLDGVYCSVKKYIV